MIDWLLDPFSSSFAQRAAIECLLVAVLAPNIGVWIIHRQLSYMADAMSHSTLLGVVIGFSILGREYVLVGALVIGLFMTALISVFGTNRKLPKDAVIAVIGSGLFAGGIIGVNKADTNISLNHFLFGQVLTVTSADVVITLILVLIVLAYIVSQFRDLVFSTFDPLHALQVGIRARRQEGVLLILIAMSVVVCISSVGIVLTVSLLISPALTSRLFSSTALQQALIGTMIAIGQVFGGFLISFHLNLPPGPTITVVGLIIFLLSFSLTSLIKDEVRVQRHRA
jgi:ABC-type Mn2+/Zn2+ transport system permease subunit